MAGQSSDPFHAFRDELDTRVKAGKVQFAEWKDLLENTNTASGSDFRRGNAALKKEISALHSIVNNDLAQIVQRIASQRSRFPHITDGELGSRQLFVKDMQQEVAHMRNTITSQRTLGKIEKDEREELSARRKTKHVRTEKQAGRHADFVADTQQQQQMMFRQQDEHLGDLEQSVGRLNEVAGAINVEIDEQNRMLDDFDEDLDATMGRMEGVLTKMDKMLKSKNRCQTFSILFLVVTLVILAALVLWT